MPLYQFKNSQTEQVEEHLVRMADVDQFLADNPHLTRMMSAPAIGDAIRIFGNRDGGFREVLQKTKAAHPLGEWGRVRNNV